MESEPGIRIPPSHLSPAALRGVIEEFVTRDGTELTDSTVKIAEVEDLLRRGEVELWFNPENQSCSIMKKE